MKFLRNNPFPFPRHNLPAFLRQNQAINRPRFLQINHHVDLLQFQVLFLQHNLQDIRLQTRLAFLPPNLHDYQVHSLVKSHHNSQSRLLPRNHQDFQPDSRLYVQVQFRRVNQSQIQVRNLAGHLYPFLQISHQQLRQDSHHLSLHVFLVLILHHSPLLNLHPDRRISLLPFLLDSPVHSLHQNLRGNQFRLLHQDHQEFQVHNHLLSQVEFPQVNPLQIQVLNPPGDRL